QAAVVPNRRRATSVAEQRIDPGELDQPHCRLEWAGPVPAAIRWVLTDPMFQPLDTLGGSCPMIQDVGGHCQPDQLMPPAKLPNHLDVAAVRQVPVIEVEGDRTCRQIRTAQIVGMPAGRVVDAQLELTEGPPPAVENSLCVAGARVAENRRGGAAGWQTGIGAGTRG